MKQIDNSSIILRFSDEDGVIHDIDLDSILDSGFPINGNGSGEDMEYIATYVLG